MARGNGRTKGKKRKDHSKHSRNSKFKFGKDKKKAPRFRDIKHTDQFKDKPIPVVSKKVRVEEPEIEEEIPLDPLTQLLSTFTRKNNDLSNIAIDSDEESVDEEDVENVENPEMEEDGDFSDLMDDEVEDESSEEEFVKDLHKTGGSDSDNESNGDCSNDSNQDMLINEQKGENYENNENIELDLDANFEEEEKEVNNLLDPFHKHLTNDLNDSLLESVSKFPLKVDTETSYWPKLHNIKIEIPKQVQKEVAEALQKPQLTIENEQEYAIKAEAPKPIEEVDWTRLCVKSQIHKNLAQANLSQKENGGGLSPLQKELFSILNNYQDLYYPERTLKNGDEIRFVYCLHVVNHILKTRLRVIHHNGRLNKKLKQEVPDEFRDQGLVRPKVLILVPFRESCLRIVNMISAILIKEDKGNIVNKSRFQEEFSGSELALPRKNPKPEDYEALFQGNVDDTFRIGLNFTKKSLKLYSEFYSSDVIIASPLGLRMVIGAEGDRGRDFDFLASIELLIMDQSDVFLMQNWDHLLHVFDHLHVQPKESHGTDFSRVRSWALQGWTKYYRQTILLSSLTTPELNAVFNRRCSNYAGSVRVMNPVADGSICSVVVQVPQVFHKFTAASVVDSLDARFALFTEKILPLFRDPVMTGVLLYVPSYFDYVRLRNHLKREDFNFVQICEYSKDAKVARARDMFFHNEARLLLYSERFHFFRRIRLKGVKHIVFYQPPTFPHFYPELCNFMQEGNQNRFLTSDGNQSVTVIYCKYDLLQLSAIVKTARAARMVASDKQVHMFTTG